MSNHIRKGERGITLIEILLVIALIGILTATAVPQFQAISQNLNLRAVARELYGHFQQAKMEAIKRNAIVAIRFESAATDGYLLYVDRNANGAVDHGEEVLTRVVLPNSVKLSDISFAANRAAFTARGRPSGGTGRVTLRSLRTGKTYSLTTSVAGYVHLN